jgi:hypothetical protein
MPKTKIDTLVMILGERNSGKSNQIRSLFEEFELYDSHSPKGYPAANMIARKYEVHPDMDLFMRVSSWHEMKKSYSDVKRDIRNGYSDIRRRYKLFVAAQISATPKLIGGEELFIRLFSDFDVRRGVAVWLSPDRTGSKPFALSRRFANFMSRRRHVSALAIDSLARHPSADPKKNSINSRLLADLLFRFEDVSPDRLFAPPAIAFSVPSR